MIAETIRDVFVRSSGGRLIEVILVTGGSLYRLTGEGASRVTALDPALEAVLPGELKGARIVECRCDGNSIAVRLDNGCFVSLGRELRFLSRSQVTDDFVAFFGSLNSCDER
jgi:hypothetical protein